MKNTYTPNDVLRSPKVRVVLMLAFVIAVVTLGIFAYERYDSYEEYYHGYDYYFHDYEGYEDGYYGDLIEIEGAFVRISAFEWYDYDSNLAVHYDYIYEIDFESMSGNLIGPRMGIFVTFNPNGGNTIPGEGIRTTSTGDSSGGTIGPGNMPANPTHDLARTIRGWNTQADGKGQAFHQDFHICAINGPFEVYMIWYVTVSFDLLGAALPIGTDQNNPNHFVARTHIPEGWTIDETPGRAFPRELTLASDRPGYTFHGWWDTPGLVGGSRYFGNTPIYDTIMLRARWTPPSNPTVTFLLEGGTLAPNHSAVREAYPGASINDSSREPDPGGLPYLNVGVRWPRTGPAVIPPTPGQYLEGWWTAPGGWGGAGDRFASPGYQLPGVGGSPLCYYMRDRPTKPVPGDWAHVPITTDTQVYAHWVYRVIFHTNIGQITGGVAGGSPHSGVHIPQQPAHFYPRQDGGTRSASSGSYLLFRDIPVTAPPGASILTHGVQRNIFTDQPVNRQYLPVGTAANAEDLDLSRAGHTFNGWWSMPMPSYRVVAGNTYVVNPRIPSTVAGTIWENAYEFFVDTPVTGSRRVYAHWLQNDAVVVTFDPMGGYWYRQHDAWRPRPFVDIGNTAPHSLELPGPGPGTQFGGNIRSTPQNVNSPYMRTMPTFPRKDGYVFVGWYSHPQGYFPPRCGLPLTAPANNPLAPICSCPYFNAFLSQRADGMFYRRITFSDTSVVPYNMTVYAHWKPYIRLEFDPMGGAVTGDRRDYRNAPLGYALSVSYANPQHHSNPLELAPYVVPHVPYSMGVLMGLGWDHTIQHGAPYYYHINRTPFHFYVERPGFERMETQWEWSNIAARNNWMVNIAGYGPTNVHPHGVGPGGANNPAPGFISVAQSTTMWNTHPLGTDSIFLGINVTFDSLAPHATNGVLTFYAQWGVPITFQPNLGAFGLTPPAARVINVPASYTFDNRHLSWHTPPIFHRPPVGPYAVGGALTGGVGTHMPVPNTAPLWQPPTSPGSAINWTWTLAFPCRNPERPRVANAPVTPTDGNWDVLFNLTHQGTQLRQLFQEWNTMPCGSGITIDSDTPFPLVVDGQYVGATTVYAIWAGNAFRFHPNHNDGVNTFGPAVVNWPSGWAAPNVQGYRNAPFTMGSPMSWPGAFPYDPTGVMTFTGWNAQRNGLGFGFPAIGNINFTTPDTYYAQWAVTVTFNVNGGNPWPAGSTTTAHANLGQGIAQVPLNNVSTPTRTGQWSLRPVNDGRWNTQNDGRGDPVVPLVSPIITGPTTVYAQWDGRLDFNLNGGHINNNSATVTRHVPEFFTIQEALVSDIPTVPARAALPDNPVHPDPSMVFMGWRIASGQPLFSHPTFGNNAILTRAQVASIEMNGLMNPAGPADGPRNAPTGQIQLEAVWHQRLIFTKTGEQLYATNRVIEPRDGAIFEVRRLNTVTSNWDVVQTGIVSGAALPAVGTDVSEPPFAPGLPASPAGIPHGRVAMTLPLTPGGQYRIFEILPPLGYQRESGHWEINLQTGAGVVDSRITNIVTDGQHASFLHGLNFIDLNESAATPIQNWHVGNRRPRLTFTKLDRDGNPLNGAIFTIERRSRSRANSGASWSPWADWTTVYTAEPSGSAIPMFPGQVTPITPTAGVVVITRPFTPLDATNDTYEFEYRLREIAVPDSSGYLIPILGRWNITVNRYSGVDAIVPCTELSAVPVFPDSDLNISPNAPNNWRLNWTVGNTPTRYWPFFKGNMFHPVANPGQFEYLPGAEFRLFVYNGTGSPADNLVVNLNNIVPSPAPGTSQPGTWSHVVTRTSSGDFTNTIPNPMWFPMMPGRHYQLVETIAPAGFQVPWGQWRITVTGAGNASIQGTGLDPNEIAMGGVGIQGVVELQNHVIIGECLPHCLNDCEDPHMNPITAFLINNRMEFDLPMTGGEGPLIVTAVGLGLAGISLVLLIAMRGKRKDKGKGKQNG